MIEPFSAALIALIVSIPWAFIAYTIYQTPEKFEKWVSMVSLLFSWASLTLEKRGIAGNIQSDIASISKNINSETGSDLLPYGIQINWTRDDSRESFVRSNDVVIRLRHHRNQAKNFLYATIAYTEAGLLPHVRRLINKQVVRAVELTFTNKILVDLKRHDVQQLFIDEIFDSEVKKNSTLERYCNVMDRLEKTGAFTHIALKEFSDLHEREGLGVPSIVIPKETVEFIKMLERLVSRKKGEDSNLNFFGEYIKSTIVLVAKPETYFTYGISPYLRYINSRVKDGIRRFYVCAIGEMNIPIVERIADAYSESKVLLKIFHHKYPISKSQNAICVILETKLLKTEPKKEIDNIQQNTELITMIQKAVNESADETGWSHLADVGHIIKQKSPDFNTRAFGYKKLSDLIIALDSYELKIVQDEESTLQKYYLKNKNPIL